MATFSVVTTPEIDDALKVLRARLNKDRAEPLTAVEFRTYLVSQWLDSLVSQAGEYSRTTLREAWERADQGTRDQVKATLGMT